MSLNDELRTFREGVKAQLPPEIFGLLEQGTEQLRNAGVGAKALREGASAPDFTLPDVSGKPLSLSSLLKQGPVVLLFYRGAWCPYCNLEIRAYQAVLTRIRSAGANLVAVSPQLPDGSLSMQEKHSLEFPVLSDVGSIVAKAYGIAFDLPEALHEIHRSFGADLPTINGKGDWVLPIPATYVIAPDGRIIRAHADVDYTVRMEPQEVLDTLERMTHA